MRVLTFVALVCLVTVVAASAALGSVLLAVTREDHDVPGGSP